MTWLMKEGEVLCSLEVANGRRALRRGLLGRSGLEGALLLPDVRAVHTLGMRFPIDVAYLSEGHVILRTRHMAPMRLGVPVLRARAVLEAEAGAFTRWRLHVGDRLEVR